MQKWFKGFLLAVLAACSTVVAAQPRDNLRVQLSAPQPVLRGDVDVTVNVTVTNTGRQPVQVLSWQLPGAEVEGALFRIAREDGSTVRYTGMRVKRAGPQAADFVRIDPGASLSYEVELTQSYDLARNGRYTIEYLSRGSHGASRTELKSDPLYLWLEGRTATASSTTAAAAPITPQAATLTTTNCSTTQITDINTAITNALAMSTNAQSYLAANNRGARYTTWFGTYDAGRYATVKAHFDSLATAFSSAPIAVDCKCKKSNTYAYVYPTQPYKIYVCGAFWNAPATGTDSKAGTLVHEMSHFNVVAATDDWAYGQTNAKALAISDPVKAVDNADSHEYFAENTPALN